MAVTAQRLEILVNADVSGAVRGLSQVDQASQKTAQNLTRAGGSVKTAGTSMQQFAGQAGGLVSTLAKTASGAGLAVFGVTQLAGAAQAAGRGLFGYNSGLEQAGARLTAFTKDAAESQRILRQISAEAAKTPFAFGEMADAGAALLPVAKQANVELMSLLKTAEILAASNPMEGLSGASFALREAASGDFQSLIERFNISRSLIRDLKESGATDLDVVHQAMAQLGLDMDLVNNLAQTGAGKWSTFTDNLSMGFGQIMAPAFEVAKGKLDEFLAASDSPQAQAFATNMADRVEDLANTLGDLVSEHGADFVNLLADGVETGAQFAEIAANVAGAVMEVKNAIDSVTDGHGLEILLGAFALYKGRGMIQDIGGRIGDLFGKGGLDDLTPKAVGNMTVNAGTVIVNGRAGGRIPGGGDPSRYPGRGGGAETIPGGPVAAGMPIWQQILRWVPVAAITALATKLSIDQLKEAGEPVTVGNVAGNILGVPGTPQFKKNLFGDALDISEKDLSLYRDAHPRTDVDAMLAEEDAMTKSILNSRNQMANAAEEEARVRSETLARERDIAEFQQMPGGNNTLLAGQKEMNALLAEEAALVKSTMQVRQQDFALRTQNWDMIQGGVDLNISQSIELIGTWEQKLNDVQRAKQMLLDKQKAQGGFLSDKDRADLELLGWGEGRTEGGIKDQDQGFITSIANGLKLIQVQDDLNTAKKEGTLNEQQYRKVIEDATAAIDPTLQITDPSLFANQLATNIDAALEKIKQDKVQFEIDAQLKLDREKAEAELASAQPVQVPATLDLAGAAGGASLTGDEVTGNLPPLKVPVTPEVLTGDEVTGSISLPPITQTVIPEIDTTDIAGEISRNTPPVPIPMTLVPISGDEVTGTILKAIPTILIPVTLVYDAPVAGGPFAGANAEAAFEGKTVHILADTSVFDGAKATVEGFVFADKSLKILADPNNAYEGINGVQGAANALVSTPFTITPYVNIGPALAAIAELSANIPRSPAKKGPFSQPANWGWVFKGMADSARRYSREASDELALVGNDLFTEDGSPVRSGFYDQLDLEPVPIPIELMVPEDGSELPPGFYDELDVDPVSIPVEAVPSISGEAWAAAINTDLDSILSGEATRQLEKEINDLETKWHLALARGASGEEVDKIAEELTKKKERLAAIGEIYAQAVTNGMVDAFRNGELAEQMHEALVSAWEGALDKVSSLITGEMPARLESDLRLGKAKLALAIEGGAPTEVIAALAKDVAGMEAQVGILGEIAGSAILRGLAETIKAEEHSQMLSDALSDTWTKAFNDFDAFKSGQMLFDAQENYRKAQEQLAVATSLGGLIPAEVFQQIADSAAIAEQQVLSLAEAYQILGITAKDVAAEEEMTKMWRDTLDSIDELVSGDGLKEIQDRITDINEQIAVATAAGLSQAVIDSLIKTRDELLEELSRGQAIADAARSIGVGIVVPLSEGIANAIGAAMKSAGAGEQFTQSILDALESGRVTMDQAIGLLADTSKEALLDARDDLAGQLIDAILSGEDTTELQARMNALNQIIAQHVDKASELTDFQQSLKDQHIAELWGQDYVDSLTAASDETKHFTDETIQGLLDAINTGKIGEPLEIGPVTLIDRDFWGPWERVSKGLGALPSDVTITAHVNIEPALESLALLDEHLPHSPAKRGPLSKAPNWDYLFGGVSDSAAMHTTKALRELAALSAERGGSTGGSDGSGELSLTVNSLATLDGEPIYRNTSKRIRRAYGSGPALWGRR